MAVEKSQLKFAVAKNTGELIGFVSQHTKTKKLMGVREDSPFRKKICVLSENLKGSIEPNLLYNVELKPMHNSNGYVVVSAEPLLFEATIEQQIVLGKEYKVKVSFGNKTIYFDPKDGCSSSSKTIEGVLQVLKSRKDIANKDVVIEQFLKHAEEVNSLYISYITSQTKK